MKSSACLSPDPRSDEFSRGGAEESVMLGVRWCLIVQRPGVGNCDGCIYCCEKARDNTKCSKVVIMFFPQTERNGLNSGRLGLWVASVTAASQTRHKSFHLSSSLCISRVVVDRLDAASPSYAAVWIKHVCVAGWLLFHTQLNTFFHPRLQMYIRFWTAPSFFCQKTL